MAHQVRQGAGTAPKIQFDTSGWDRHKNVILQAMLHISPDILIEVGLEAMAVMQDEAPVGKYAKGSPFPSGANRVGGGLRSSIEMQPIPPVDFVKILPTVDYALLVEKGTIISQV